jgi:hypothetical protein
MKRSNYISIRQYLANRGIYPAKTGDITDYTILHCGKIAIRVSKWITIKIYGMTSEQTRVAR